MNVYIALFITGVFAIAGGCWMVYEAKRYAEHRDRCELKRSRRGRKRSLSN